MPIYEILCQKCLNLFEIIQKADEKLPNCPKCKAKQVKKLISSGSFDLKGVGNYKNGRS